MEAMPASIQSLSAKDMQEDHNSMGGSSLNDLLLNVGRADTILAGEYLLSTQAIALIEPKMQGLRLGKGTQRVKELISTKVGPPGDDRFFRDDLDIVRKLVCGGDLHAAVDDD
jgi:histidine ammonia-lyase